MSRNYCTGDFFQFSSHVKEEGEWREDRGAGTLPWTELEVATARAGGRFKISVDMTEKFIPASVPLNYDSKKMTGMVGLENLGATCYLNALLQVCHRIDFVRLVPASKKCFKKLLSCISFLPLFTSHL